MLCMETIPVRAGNSSVFFVCNPPTMCVKGAKGISRLLFSSALANVNYSCYEILRVPNALPKIFI